MKYLINNIEVKATEFADSLSDHLDMIGDHLSGVEYTSYYVVRFFQRILEDGKVTIENTLYEVKQ
jgi:hypothetical protein